MSSSSNFVRILSLSLSLSIATANTIEFRCIYRLCLLHRPFPHVVDEFVWRPRVSKRNHNKEERGRYLRVPDVNCLHERWGQLFRLATWQTLHWCATKCFRMTGPRDQLRTWWKLGTSRWREPRRHEPASSPVGVMNRGDVAWLFIGRSTVYDTKARVHDQ